MIAGILGATGYAGVELTRILVSHPAVERIFLSSTSREGDQIEAAYPHLRGVFVSGKVSSTLLSPDEVAGRTDVVFSALPAGTVEPFAALCIEKKVPFIDFSADFRFDDEEVYRAWYGRGWDHPELHEFALYGLPELNRAAIKKRVGNGRGHGYGQEPGRGHCPVIIGNPGCYPTASTLGLLPALREGLAGKGTIIADCASGLTGAGRELKRETHYSESADSMAAYGVGGHRHTPEIIRNVRQIEGGNRTVIFTPHLTPMNRGILATLYIPLPQAGKPAPKRQGLLKTASVPPPLPASPETAERAAAIRETYTLFYRDEPFVRVLPAGLTASTARVRGSNFCDISIHLDHTGTTLIVCAAIDNMVKGAAGQAVQNMNIILGQPETAGLELTPLVF